MIASQQAQHFPPGSTICLTGARGLIGKHILERLKSQDIQIRILTRSNDKLDHPKVKTYQGDLTQAETLKDFLDGCHYFFNCAGEISNPLKMMETNAVGVENLVNSASTIESLKCFCHVSSAGVTGKTSDLVVTEETPCNPGNLYEESKWIGEKHILDSNLACPIRILRPINVIDKENKGILDFIFNKNFKSYLKLLLLGRENAHVVPASMIAKAALHLSLTPGINEKVFFVSLDEDPKNKFFDLWKLISKSNFILSLPLFMTNLIRTKLLGGNASQTKYSSQLLKNTGFKSFPTIEEVIQEVSQ